MASIGKRFGFMMTLVALALGSPFQGEALAGRQLIQDSFESNRSVWWFDGGGSHSGSMINNFNTARFGSWHARLASDTGGWSAVARVVTHSGNPYGHWYGPAVCSVGFYVRSYTNNTQATVEVTSPGREASARL